MAWDKREIIGLLRLEVENIRRRGFGACFRESVLCLNAGSAHPAEPCDQCILLELVPPEARQKPRPCFHIPLDADGRTIDLLVRQGNRRDCEQALLAWMEQTLRRLERELAAERAASQSAAE